MPAQYRPFRKRIIKNHGLSAFSREQGVSVHHAWRVVTGHRESRRLLAAWEAFKKQQEASR